MRTHGATRLLALILSLPYVARIQTDKSLRHVAATGCCNKSLRVTCENHCRSDRILSPRSVARIQTGLNSCDISQRENKRKQPSRSVCTHLKQVALRKFKSPNKEASISHVKFELICIFSLPQSIACTEQVSHRNELSHQQCRRGDLSPRCVAAICRIVCLGLNTTFSITLPAAIQVS